MANSRYAYVRQFELPDPLLPGTFILLRIDGSSFHRFADTHRFAKPNDTRGLELMDHAAVALMRQHPDIILGFGQSDEYSFLLRKDTTLYNRRRSKITSTLCSFFTAAYVVHWPTFFPENPLRYPPSFDARIVLYPGVQEIRDYFSWRQVDTHINNLYNTTFWALVRQGGQTPKDAHETLRGTASSQKNEMLFSRFGINYNALPSRFRKGSVLVREQLFDGEVEGSLETSSTAEMPRTNSFGSLSLVQSPTVVGAESEVGSPRLHRKNRTRQGPTRIAMMHCDIIGNEFWDSRPYLLMDD
ncbi:Thg1 C terminal domain-containing protein [Russula compacta]|nr:Thg1 C terminal domain-containing protein [Russula compacta]